MDFGLAFKRPIGSNIRMKLGYLSKRAIYAQKMAYWAEILQQPILFAENSR